MVSGFPYGRAKATPGRKDEPVTKPDDEKEGADDMTTAAPEAADPIVQLSGRIPASLRRRMKIAAAAQDIDGQTALRQALEEYLTKRGF